VGEIAAAEVPERFDFSATGFAELTKNHGVDRYLTVVESDHLSTSLNSAREIEHKRLRPLPIDAFPTELGNDDQTPRGTRTICAAPTVIFQLLCDPKGHVMIDSSGMLQSSSGQPVKAAGDSFVVYMDREALND
jgi:hypothetical protein